MGRPEKKTKEIRLKVSDREIEIIQKKADEVGLSMSEFCRTLALISHLKSTNETSGVKKDDKI